MVTKEPTGRDEITLKELYEKANDWYVFFLSKWKLILIAGTLGCMIGLVYSLLKKPVYSAALTFAVEDGNSGDSGGVLSLASQFGFSLGGSGGGIFEGTNLNELFKSRSIVEQTLMMPVSYKEATISYAEMYIQINKWRQKWENKPQLAKIQFYPNTKRKYFTRVHDSILGVIYGNISKSNLTVGQKDKKVNIITMEVTSTNEQFSKDFCEALAKEVGSFYVATKSKKARVNMEILERQTDSIRVELNNAITGVATANDNTFNLNPALNVRRVPSSQKQVDVQANAAILTELVKQTELAKVSFRRETPLIQVLDRPIYPLKIDRVGKLKGIAFGGVLGGILIIFILAIKYYFLKVALSFKKN